MYAQSVKILSPISGTLTPQENGVADITVEASAKDVPALGCVQLVLDMGKSTELSVKIYKRPYRHVFKAVPAGEHTVDAFVCLPAGQWIAYDNCDRVGIGDLIVAVGDGITAGEGDNICTDNQSADGRNGPCVDQWGNEYGGFVPILNDILTEARGYPHNVINEGCPGETTSGALSRIESIIAQYPTAKTWLISYGTIDCNKSMSVSTFKSNIKKVIEKIQSSIPGAAVYLPKVFYWSKPIVSDYNDAMGDIIRSTPNVFWGADLDTLFRSNHAQYNHLTGQKGTLLSKANTHCPNGVGVQKMALLWKLALVDRAIIVTDGFLSAAGNTWADRIRIEGANTIGLDEGELLLVCEEPGCEPEVPPGTSMTRPFSFNVKLLGEEEFKDKGFLRVTVREEDSIGDFAGLSCWDQVWLAEDTTLLATTRTVNLKNSYDRDLTAIITKPGHIATVADTEAPVTTCTPVPGEPNGDNGWYANIPQITMCAVDSTGTPAKTYYRWDKKGKFILYNGQCQASLGVHTLYYYSIDQSGNVEPMKTMEFKVYLVPTAGYHSITGKVTMLDCINPTLYPVIAELRNKTTGMMYVRAVYLASDGSYTLQNVEAGQYDIAFKASHWLRKVVPSMSVTSNISGVNVSLINGDCDGNNKVDMADYNVLSAAWSTWVGHIRYNPAADLDNDGTVGFGDLNILKKNLNKSGDM